MRNGNLIQLCSGRYYQGSGVLSHLGGDAVLLGRRALVVADAAVWPKVEARVLRSLEQSGVDTKIWLFSGHCCPGNVRSVAQAGQAYGAELVVGVGGGATSLIGFCANKMNIKYSVPENAEVISSIGVALAMVRDVVERVVPNPTPDDIRSIKREAVDKAVESGAAPGSVEVHIEIDPQTSKLTAIALGSTEVKTTDLLKECSEEEARNLAAEDLRSGPEELNLVGQTPNFYVYNMESRGRKPLRILDKKGFIKVQRTDGEVVLAKASSYRSIVSRMWEEMAIFKADAILRPDYYLCVGARVMDFNGTGELEQILMLMDVEMQMVDPSEDIVIVGAKNQL